MMCFLSGFTIFKLYQKQYRSMSLHSSKYYHLIKTLRIQKHHSQISKTLKQRQHINKNANPYEAYTEQDIDRKMQFDNSLEFDEKDKKMTVKLSKVEEVQQEYPRLWLEFQDASMTKSIKEDSVPLQKVMFQKKDEKLIDDSLEDSQAMKNKKMSQVQNLLSKIKKKEEDITSMKEKAIELTLQLQAQDKAFQQLKLNFQKEEKNINQRSTKYKEEKSKDMMIKFINKEDMEMRKVMASKIKLNQQLDLGFQIQRRRAFNQAKQAINEKKKIAQEKYNKIKLVLSEHQKKQQEYINQKNKLENEIEVIKKEVVYFAKQILKHFKNHSRGIQWLTKILQEENVQIKEEDLPSELKKEDATFLSSVLEQVKTHRSQTKSKYHPTSVHITTPKSHLRRRIEYNFKTQPNLQEDDSLFADKPQKIRHKLSKTTVYFDIQKESSIQQSPRNGDAPTFNINSRSLKKVYQNTSTVISKMIKNKNWNYESCKVMSASQMEHTQEIILQKKIIEDKIKEKFTNIRQKQRRNYMKKLLFGQRK